MKNRQKIWQPETAAYKRFQFPMHETVPEQQSTQQENPKPTTNTTEPPSPHPGETDTFTKDETEQHYRKGYLAGKQDGYQTGLKEGHTNGLNEGKNIGVEEGQRFVNKKQAEFIDTLHKKLALIQQSADQGNEERILWLTRVVEETCRQVVRCELATDSSRILKVIEETLSLMPETKQCSIHLNPHDSELLKERKPDLGVAWQIIDDPGVSMGDCKIMSDETEAEARLESRLVECLDIIKETLPISLQEVG